MRDGVREALKEAITACLSSQSELARRMSGERTARQKYVQQHIWHWLRVGRIPAEHVRLIEGVTGVPSHRLCPDVFRESDKAA